MKTTLKFFTLALVILGFSATSFAQNSASATANASGTIVTPIAITKVADMKFGTIVAAAGTVTLVPGNATPTYSGVAAFTGTGPIAPSTAKFTVTGNNNNTYAINVSGLPTVVTHTDASTTMALGSWTSNQGIVFPAGTGTGTLSATGTQSFEIGATLTVAALQKAGTYTSSAFTVTVNYN